MTNEEFLNELEEQSITQFEDTERCVDLAREALEGKAKWKARAERALTLGHMLSAVTELALKRADQENQMWRNRAEACRMLSHTLARRLNLDEGEFARMFLDELTKTGALD